MPCRHVAAVARETAARHSSLAPIVARLEDKGLVDKAQGLDVIEPLLVLSRAEIAFLPPLADIVPLSVRSV